MALGAASAVWCACANGGDAGNEKDADGPAWSRERPGGAAPATDLEIPGGGAGLDSALWSMPREAEVVANKSRGERSRR